MGQIEEKIFQVDQNGATGVNRQAPVLTWAFYACAGKVFVETQLFANAL